MPYVYNPFINNVDNTGPGGGGGGVSSVATTADIYMSGSGQTPTTLQDTNFSNSSLFSGAFIYATI